MSRVVSGIVKGGVVVPDAPLPEGERVEIVLPEAVAMPPELAEECRAWDRGSDEALALIERLAEEGERDEKG
jgi:predicted DNA-binding antitoxin AbrB/MazE fold protein